MRKLVYFVAVTILMSLLSVSYAAAPENFAKLRDAKLAEARKAVKEVTAAEVKAMADKGESFVMLDIREENEQGIVIGVGELKKLPRGLLEWTAPAQLDENDKIVVYCKTGARGAFSAFLLQELGYKNVVNLQGGIVAWLEAGYPVNTYIGPIRPDGYKFSR